MKGMINIDKYFEQEDKVIYNSKIYKIIKRIGYFDNVKNELIYDYIIFDGENAIAVTENEISEIVGEVECQKNIID